MGPVASNAVPALLTGVSDTRRSRDSAYKIEVQAMFTKALGKIGLQARATVPVLTQNLQHTNRSMRTQSAIALWRIDRQTTNTIPVLVGELNASGNPSEKRDLVECLGEMGPPAKSAVPQLAALALRADRLRGPASRFAFVDFDPTLVPVVLQALMRIDPATAAQMGIGVPEGEAGERVRFLRP